MLKPQNQDSERQSFSGRRPDSEAAAVAKDSDVVHVREQGPKYEDNELLTAARKRRKNRSTGSSSPNEDIPILIPSTRSSFAHESRTESVYELDGGFLPIELSAELPTEPPRYVAYKPGLTSPSMLSLQHGASLPHLKAQPASTVYFISSPQKTAGQEPPKDPAPVKEILVGKARSRRWLEHQSNQC